MQKHLHDVMASMLKTIAINVMECLEVTENWVDPSQVNLSMASLFTIDFLRLDRECLTHLHSERPKRGLTILAIVYLQKHFLENT